LEVYPKQYLYRQIVRAKLYIDANYGSPIDLDNIANEACFSKYHFARLFRKIYGKTPYQYLTGVRTDAAGRLLEKGLSVKQVCYAVGFDSVTSFAGLFKRRTGTSPAAFQRQRQQTLSEFSKNPLKHIPNCFAEQNGWKQNSNFREAEIVDRTASAAE